MSKICDRAAGGPGSADAVAPLAASQSRVCQHPDDSTGAGRASVAGPPDCGGPPGALAAEVAARQPVRDVPSQHAGTAPTGAGGMIPWGYFAAIAAFARLRPTLHEAQAVLAQADPQTMAPLTEGYRSHVVPSSYGGVAQRWVLIY